MQCVSRGGNTVSQTLLQNPLLYIISEKHAIQEFKSIIPGIKRVKMVNDWINDSVKMYIKNIKIKNDFIVEIKSVS